MTSSFHGKIHILSEDVESNSQAIIKLSLAYSFRKIFFIGQNLKHVHMTYSLLELLIFFWLAVVDIKCLEFISLTIPKK